MDWTNNEHRTDIDRFSTMRKGHSSLGARGYLRLEHSNAHGTKTDSRALKFW